MLGAAGQQLIAEDENLTADLCKGKRVEKKNHNLFSEINQVWPSCGIFTWQSQNIHPFVNTIFMEQNDEDEFSIQQPTKLIKCTQGCLNSHSLKKPKQTHTDFEAQLSGMHKMQKELRKNTI